MSKNILVTGLILGKETDMCPCNNINLDWVFNRSSDLLWADKILMTNNEWREIVNPKENAYDCAVKMIFERLQAEGLIQFIPDTIITPPRAESLLQSIESDLQLMQDLFSVSEDEKESLLQMGEYSYCVPSLWALYAAIDISRSVNASFSLASYELAYLKALIPRKFNKEIKAGRNLAMDEVLGLYLPSTKLGHSYLFDSAKGRCDDCAKRDQCSSGYMAEIEKQLDGILHIRQYDEVRMTCEVMDKICERSVESGHVLTGTELWEDLQVEAKQISRTNRSKLSKINMWRKISAYATIGLGAASFLNPVLGLSATIPAIAAEALSSYEGKVRKETSWVNFVSNPEAVLAQQPII